MLMLILINQFETYSAWALPFLPAKIPKLVKKGVSLIIIQILHTLEKATCSHLPSKSCLTKTIRFGYVVQLARLTTRPRHKLNTFSKEILTSGAATNCFSRVVNRAEQDSFYFYTGSWYFCRTFAPKSIKRFFFPFKVCKLLNPASCEIWLHQHYFK